MASFPGRVNRTNPAGVCSTRRGTPWTAWTGSSLAASSRRPSRKPCLLAQEANRYLDEQAPWKTIKTDRAASARSVYTILSLLTTLRTALYPFLPFSSERLHSYLGFDGSVKEQGWKAQFLPPGQRLRQPEPLFIKLDEDVVAQETGRLGGPAADEPG